jgi:hypothetical protein
VPEERKEEDDTDSFFLANYRAFFK